MCSSMKALTLRRSSRISGVMVKSGMVSSFPALCLRRGEQPHRRDALRRLFGGVYSGGNERQQGQRDAVTAIGFDLVQALTLVPEHEKVVDHLVRYQFQGRAPVAGLPGLHHGPHGLAAPEPA